MRNDLRVTCIYTFALSTVKKFKICILGLFFSSAISSLHLTIGPYLLKVIIDKTHHIENSLLIAELSKPAALYILMCILNVAVLRFYDYIWLHFKPHMQGYLTLQLMNKMINHPVSFYQDHFAGSLANKINDVMSGIPNIIRIFAEHLFGTVISIFMATYALYITNYKFSISFIVWGAIFLVLSLRYSFHVKELAQKTAEIRSQIIGTKVDILSNISSVKLFVSKKKELGHLNNLLKNFISAMQNREWFLLKMNLLQGISFALFQGVCMWFLMCGLKSGSLTRGDFVLVLTLNISLAQALLNLANNIKNLAEDVGNAKQGLNLAFSQIEMKEQKGAQPLCLKKGEIEFKNVRFSYESTPSLFSGLSVLIPAGQKVGLVGYSGSGKTTFVNLILRLYDIEQGNILIDGQDLRHVTQGSLRENIGVIPQDLSLFHRTIIDNIRYGRFCAHDDEVIEAAIKAHAHEFIMQLKDGYQSQVGEKGIKLSGGQRQRIAIARAFLKKSPILILDEATSQLDSITEDLIQKSILNLLQGNSTVLVISHRLSTLLHMDRILVFKEGKIIEDGSHLDLLSTRSVYKTMWNHQIGVCNDKNDCRSYFFI